MTSPLALLLLLPVVAAYQYDHDSSYHNPAAECYDPNGKPKKCIPDFLNAAYGLDVEVTNTCGEEVDSHYCIQTGARAYESCGVCRAGDHPAAHLTDLNSNRNQTWWQSTTMQQGAQYPNQVNLTLHLRKAYDITYVRIWFYSPRPESFAIYKRTREDGPWIPFQYYSGSCRDLYGLEDRATAIEGEVTNALCTSEYSDISPLTGGNIAFSTLEGRNITAHSFESSPQLQEWVTATDIRIVLNRMNTFGDEIFGGETVLKSYFYAITDIAVGARCKCNGHAKECMDSYEEGEVRKVCRCEHNTWGPDCQMCRPFFYDAPWRRATDKDAQECKPCNCNGFANRCFFDEDLYAKTGHGGHCLDCSANRDGPNCERCKDNYYLPHDDYCLPCQCNEIGSRSLQCNSDGKCQCKAGVTGDKCDQCMENHYDFSTSGCKECNCLAEGSLDNEPRCDAISGVCLCKANVEGNQCRRCKLGYFNLNEENEFGCTPCFCFGHSAVCSQASGYSKVVVESNFARSNEKWSGEDDHEKTTPIQYDPPTQSLGLTASGRGPTYFKAPERFLGDQRASYNQMLSFKLRIGENSPSPRGDDIILEGAGLRLTQTVFGQGNPLPSVQVQEFKFRLHEYPDYGWEPRLTAREFMSLLANLTAIKIRATYTPRGIGFIDDVKLSTARRGAAGVAATWIEMCSCPDGYIGQFCESCDAGYRHDPPGEGPFSQCIPCDCNGHADICDADTGRCICQHNTAGEHCERCARGYYGNALEKTAHDCQLCPCPEQGPCMELASGTVVCLDCPKGYAGARCDLCSDGYFGDLTGSGGSVRLCQPCNCNNNVDPNAVGNCNRTTGECLKCIYNTDGPQCERCLPGFYGDALAEVQGDCKPCMCNRWGTEETSGGPLGCNQQTGQCSCKPNVTATHCDQCLPGYYNLASGKGCELCQCSPTGSLNETCDILSGQCHCRPGVTGQRCDVCQVHHYGFSENGCQSCDCDDLGSKSHQCDPSTGQCPCLDNVEGRRCDMCKENKHDRQRGCVDCDRCYNLVQDAVNAHRRNLKALSSLLSNITDNPTVIDNADFDRRLGQVQARVEQVWLDAKQAAGDDSEITAKLESLHKKLDGLMDTLHEIKEDSQKTGNIINSASDKVNALDKTIEKTKEDIKAALEFIQLEGAAALAKARNHSAEYGQQNQQMSDIAHQARITAHKQLEEARETEEVAEQAYNTSSHAYELAKDALEKQTNVTHDLKYLDSDLLIVKEKLEQTALLAEASQNDASAAFDEALALSLEIRALNLPTIDSDQIKNGASNVAIEAMRLYEIGRQLRDTLDKAEENVTNEIKGTEDLLKIGVAKQQKLDLLLSEIDEIKEIALKAIESGEKTLNDTMTVYEAIENYDQQVQYRKNISEIALNEIPSIEILLKGAQEDTFNAQEALAGAENYEKLASENVNNTQTQFALPAANKAEGLRQGANKTKVIASGLSDEAEHLFNEIYKTADLFKEKEEDFKKNLHITQRAMAKVALAERTVAEASEKINASFNAVDDIKEHMKSDMGEIDDSNLAHLENRLDKAEEDLNNSNFSEYIGTLSKAKRDQEQLIKMYQEELSKLTQDVRNIEDIYHSLPEGCFNRLQLEAP